MKRITALLLILALALCLAACGSRSGQAEDPADVQNGAVETPEETLPVYTDPPVVAVTPTVVVTSYPVPSSTPEPTPTVAPTPSAAVSEDGYAVPTAQATDAERANGYTAYVQGSGINVRAGVGTGTDIIDVVNIGDKVLVLGEESGWTKVIFHDKVGYIYSPFIATTYPIVNTYPNAVPSNEGNATIIDSNGNATIIGGNDDSTSGTGVIIVG